MDLQVYDELYEILGATLKNKSCYSLTQINLEVDFLEY